MPDEKEKPAEKPSLLVDLVKVATEKKKDPAGSSGSSSLVIYLIVTAIAVLGFSILGWFLVRARREAARLAYELRKKEEEQKRAAEDHKLAKNGQERNEAHKKVKLLQGEIDELKKKLEAQKAAHAERTKTLEKITSWDDLVVVDQRE